MVKKATPRFAGLAGTFFLPVYLMLIGAMPGDGKLLAAEEVVVDGVPHIRNGAEPEQGSVTVPLEEAWRAGGEDDDVIFGAVSQILADEAGNLYVLDSQLCEVQVFSPAGRRLKTLSRQGEGPGEVQRPGDLFFLPNGDLGIVQSFPGRVVKITRDGTPAGTMHFSASGASQGFFGVLGRGLCRGGTIALVGFQMVPTNSSVMNQSFFFSRCDEEGKELTRYLAKEYPIDIANFVLDEQGMDFVWSGRVAVGPSGEVYMAPQRDEFAVEVLAPDGTLQRVIEKEAQTYKRTDDELKEARLNMEAVGHNYPYALRNVTVEPTDALITGLVARQDGSLWVANSYDNHHLADGIVASFDVFDRSGHLQKKLQLAGPGNTLHDALMFPGGNLAVLVIGATDAYRSMQAVSSGEADQQGEIPALEVVCFTMKGSW